MFRTLAKLPHVLKHRARVPRLAAIKRRPLGTALADTSLQPTKAPAPPVQTEKRAVLDLSVDLDRGVAPGAQQQPQEITSTGAWPGPISRRRILTTGISAITLSTLAPKLALGAVERVALVVGNSGYQKPNYLDNPQRDANAFAQLLREFGWKVTLLLDATHEQMRRGIADFADQLGPSSQSLFYYAGHAVQYMARNFMVPIDFGPIAAPASLRAETIGVDLVIGQMGLSGSRANIVILDACRDPPFLHRWPGITAGLANLEPRYPICIAFATCPNEKALDGPPGGHSPFTQALLRHARVTTDSIERMFLSVKQSVYAATDSQQLPGIYSSLVDEIYLKASSAAPPKSHPTLDSLTSAPPDKRIFYYVQFDAFKDPRRASSRLAQVRQSHEDLLREPSLDFFIFQLGALTAVRAGPIESAIAANLLCKRVKDRGDKCIVISVTE